VDCDPERSFTEFTFQLNLLVCSMKKHLLLLIISSIVSILADCQVLIIQEEPKTYKIINQLKNNTFEVRGFSGDSILFYKGILSSREPEVRNGKFYFYSKKGTVIVMGQYKADVPYGTWVYYNDSMQVVKSINYTAVWDYLEIEALNFKSDSAATEKLPIVDTYYLNPDGKYNSSDKLPEFNNNIPEDEFTIYVENNLVYPVFECQSSMSNEVRIEFIIDSQGKIRNPVILKPQSPDFNIEAIRMLSESPNWQPGYQNDKPVNVKYQWSFWFTSKNGSTKGGLQDSTEIDMPFVIVEDMPKFRRQNSEMELLRFINKNLRYPKAAQEKGISGLVVVNFIVTSTGQLKDPKVITSVDSLLDNEAVRAVMATSPWIPGKQNGKPVDVYFTVPVRFVLNK
jgi:TonB family protein